MENVSRAILMAFSMIMFVIGFTYSMYLINRLTTTSNTLLESVTTTNYYDNIKIENNDNTTNRQVGIETIIPTLYRYTKENYSVKIEDSDGNLLQLFDLKVETKMGKASVFNKTPTNPEEEELSALKRTYDDTNKKAYLFKAPWGSNTSDAKIRIDYFLNGTKGYINDQLVDYSKGGPTFAEEGGFIGYSKGKVFEESFVEYAYEGETISTADRRIGNDNRKYTGKLKNNHNI